MEMSYHRKALLIYKSFLILIRVPQLIPRAKGPAPKRPPQITLGHDASSDLSAPQAALLDVLEGLPSHHRGSSISGRAQAGSRASSRDRFDGAPDRLDNPRGNIVRGNPRFGGSRDRLDNSRDRYDEASLRDRYNSDQGDRYDDIRSSDHMSTQIIQAGVSGAPSAGRHPNRHLQGKRFPQGDEINVHGRDTTRSKSSTYRFGGER